jgi:hypothetical protein
MKGRMEMSGEDLNGADGKIFHVNQEAQRFDLLKETVIDPKTDEGKSRHTLRWTDSTRFVKVSKQNSFEGVEKPVMARFRKLDEENAKAAAEGKPFIVMEVMLLAENEALSDWDKDDNYVVGRFTADPKSDRYREGTVEIDGRSTSVRLRGPRAQVFVRSTSSAAEMEQGFWKTRVFGERQGEAFVVEKMANVQLVDPREVDNPKLPRVLVVGDSISVNYHQAAKEQLKGVANYYRIESNAGSVDRGVLCIELWLGDYEQKGLHWDLIQFNHGLHDLKQVYDKESDSYGEHNVPLDEYKKYLEQEIELMKKTGAKLMWCSTTPVPSKGNVWGTPPMGRRKDEDLVMNKAALEVIERHPEIRVNDLNAFIRGSKAFDKWREGNDVHFWGKTESDLVGKAVADAIKKALAD